MIRKKRELDMLKVRLFWLFLCLSVTLAAKPIRSSLNLKYSDVQSLGKSCPSLDSCGHRRTSGSRNLDSIPEKNCACDYMCDEFGDCCIDAPSYSDNISGKSKSDWKCYELRQFGGVYMKDKCNPDNSNDELVQLCENGDPEDYSDPLRDMPVTESNTGLTYRNYYCGMCNGFKENLVLWTPRLECPTLTLYNTSRKNLTHQYVFQNLMFDGTSWGLYLDGDNGSLFFHDCVIDPVMPLLLESKIRLCKTQSVSNCANDWEDKDVRAKCAAYTGLRYFHSESYRNVHCAVCNRVNVTLLTCQPVEYREMFVFRTFVHRAFSLLLDINEQRGQDVGLTTKCAENELFDPFFKKCRQLSCLPGSVRHGSKCMSKTQLESTSQNPFGGIITVRNETKVVEIVEPARNSTDGKDNSQNITSPVKSIMENATGITYNSSMIDGNVNLENELGKFKNCLLISLMEEDYTLYNNKTIYVPEYDKYYEPTNYVAVDGSVLVCSHFDTDHEAKFSPIMGFVTVLGLGISMLCLFLHFIVFCITPDLRNLSGKNLMSQCVAIFFAYCFYILGASNVNKDFCVIVAFLTIYFFQASFFWMSSMSFDVWRTLKMATTELRVASGKKWKRFVAYSIYSWLTPVIIISLAAFSEYTDVFPEEYKPRFAQPRCWFKHRRALLCFFAAPLFAVILSNVMLFASSARMIIITTKSSTKQQNSSQKRNFKLYLRLFILMGLTWTAGLIAGYADVQPMWYLFIILNTLQGFFIFVAFSCNTKVLNNLRDKYAKYMKSAEYRSSAVHSSSNSACNTNSTTVLTSVVIKPSSKLWAKKKKAASPSNSTASSSYRR